MPSDVCITGWKSSQQGWPLLSAGRSIIAWPSDREQWMPIWWASRSTKAIFREVKIYIMSLAFAFLLSKLFSQLRERRNHAASHWNPWQRAAPLLSHSLGSAAWEMSPPQPCNSAWINTHSLPGRLLALPRLATISAGSDPRYCDAFAPGCFWPTLPSPLLIPFLQVLTLSQAIPGQPNISTLLP